MCIIDIAQSFSAHADSQRARLQIRALNLLRPLDRSLLLVLYKLLNLLRIQRSQLLLATIQLFDALLLLRHELASLLLNNLALIAQHLQLLLLCSALLFILLVRRAHCAEHLFVDLAKLSTNFVLLKALEHILKVFFVDQADGAWRVRRPSRRLWLFLGLGWCNHWILLLYLLCLLVTWCLGL